MITEDEIRAECAGAMRDILGEGYVPDYYEDMSSDFVQIVVWFLELQKKESSCANCTRRARELRDEANRLLLEAQGLDPA